MTLGYIWRVPSPAEMNGASTVSAATVLYIWNSILWWYTVDRALYIHKSPSFIYIFTWQIFTWQPTQQQKVKFRRNLRIWICYPTYYQVNNTIFQLALHISFRLISFRHLLHSSYKIYINVTYIRRKENIDLLLSSSICRKLSWEYVHT